MPIGKATEPFLASRARLLIRDQLKIRDLLSGHRREGFARIVRAVIDDRPLLMASRALYRCNRATMQPPSRILCGVPPRCPVPSPLSPEP